MIIFEIIQNNNYKMSKNIVFKEVNVYKGLVRKLHRVDKNKLMQL